MSNKVALVTDSTSYIPQSWIDEYNIKVAPLVVIWGEEELRDNIDISAGEFFQRLPTADVMPSTSQPSPADFKAIYEPLVAEGYGATANFVRAWRPPALSTVT